MAVGAACLLALGNWALGDDDKAAAIAEREAFNRRFENELLRLHGALGKNRVDVFLEGDDVAGRKPSLSQVEFASLAIIGDDSFWRFRGNDEVYLVRSDKVACFRVYESK